MARILRIYHFRLGKAAGWKGDGVKIYRDSRLVTYTGGNNEYRSIC